jgi:HD-GYP domain-containing protein (c-di-GMP phosphodiesterase class II)
LTGHFGPPYYGSRAMQATLEPTQAVAGLEEALRLHLGQVERLQEQLRGLRSAVVETIAALMGARDSAMSAHSEAVTNCSVVLARALELDNGEVEAVRLAALLHDVGKIASRRCASPRSSTT